MHSYHHHGGLSTSSSSSTPRSFFVRLSLLIGLLLLCSCERVRGDGGSTVSPTGTHPFGTAGSLSAPNSSATNAITTDIDRAVDLPSIHSNIPTTNEPFIPSPSPSPSPFPVPKSALPPTAQSRSQYPPSAADSSLVPFFPLPASAPAVLLPPTSLPGPISNGPTSSNLNSSTLKPVKRYIIRLSSTPASPSTSLGPSVPPSPPVLHSFDDARSILSASLPSFDPSRVTHVFPTPSSSPSPPLSPSSLPPSPSPLVGFSAYLTDAQLSVLRGRTDLYASIEEDGLVSIEPNHAPILVRQQSTGVTLNAHASTSTNTRASANASPAVSVGIIQGVAPQAARANAASDKATRSWALDRIDQRSLPLDGLYDPYFDTNSANYTSSSALDGTGVNIYLVDTGCMTNHREFLPKGRASIVYSSSPSTLDDANGHGSHTASLAGGALIGAAKKAQINCLRVLDSKGSGTYSDILSSLNWLRSNVKHPAVLSMSFGGTYSKSLNDMSLQLVGDGIHVIVAMGNSGASVCHNDSSGYSPASVAGSSAVIAVGSIGSNDSFSSFSNYGPCMTISAPGEDIIGAWPPADPTSNAVNTYAILSGTSMSTPIVAGVVAMFIAKYPNSQ